MKRAGLLLLFVGMVVFVAHGQRPAPDQIATQDGPLSIQPIQHGTLVLSWNDQQVYIDPTGGARAFEGLAAPDVIVITHAHGDHMNIETLKALDTEGVQMVVPQSVADELPEMFSDQLIILDNGESTDQFDFAVSAMPMYNLPDDESSRHPKGWGNGYVITFDDKKVYISGDTEGIPEMRSLKNIDVAFVCMNLPYTMGVEQAASAVHDFEPDVMYPYHYRGQDTEKFKQLVTQKNEQIEVRLRNWYPGN